MTQHDAESMTQDGDNVIIGQRAAGISVQVTQDGDNVINAQKAAGISG